MALARYAEERYADFGPTLMAEQLAKEGLVVDHETLRRWRLAEGSTRSRRRSKCTAVAGAQAVPGSDGATGWFAPRLVRRAAGQCVLMVMVDDATGRLWAQFFRRRRRVPAMTCSRVGAPPRIARQSVCGSGQHLPVRRVGQRGRTTGGQEPQTQFGRAMETLAVELILANSPQAKGRVERMNGVLQDRLVKAMRLAGISDLESANGFWRRHICRRSTGSSTWGRPVPPMCIGRCPGLDEVLSWEEERVVQGNWTVVCGAVVSTGPAT